MYLCDMKRGLVYFLLIIFALQNTKGLWIVTSFHINRNYIAENICINRFDKIPTCKGQCFLNKQLDQDQKENKNNLTSAEKEVIFIAPESTEIALQKNILLIEEKKYSFHPITEYASFLFKLENPPELV